MVQGWVKELTKSIFGKCPLYIGAIIKHPDGRTVKIIEGKYWGEFGLSNYWSWREVLPNGELGKLEKGYGWTNEISHV